mmetsp:Transcript_90903/g.273019  ORF Transcript_90903/g.273019 Transcript_90903/m.273019 type:complete len:224 (+) Transcript_90903:493-1164(+)
MVPNAAPRTSSPAVAGTRARGTIGEATSRSERAKSAACVCRPRLVGVEPLLTARAGLSMASSSTGAEESEVLTEDSSAGVAAPPGASSTNAAARPSRGSATSSARIPVTRGTRESGSRAIIAIASIDAMSAPASSPVRPLLTTTPIRIEWKACSVPMVMARHAPSSTIACHCCVGSNICAIISSLLADRVIPTLGGSGRLSPLAPLASATSCRPLEPTSSRTS